MPRARKLTGTYPLLLGEPTNLDNPMFRFSKYTKEQIQTAREYAAGNAQRCAEKCFDDDFGFAQHVTYTDKVAYRADQLENADAIKKGERDHNFTIRQRMHYFLTGESVALLPK